MHTQPLLHVRDLNVSLTTHGRAVSILDHVEFCLYPGETVALLGESGCGKSLTALALMRLLPLGLCVSQGTIEYAGTELLALPEQAMRKHRGQHMAMIFQEPQTSLNPVMTIGQQIAEALPATNRRQRTERIIQLLRDVGIADPERRIQEYPHQLSGGMKQRVMIAMALAGEPQLLIADEPTTALDVTIQAQVLQLLKTVQQRTGLAILLITHDLGVVAETADRLAVMYAGQIVEQAHCDSFFQQPLHPYSQRLLASLPTMTKREQRLAMIPGVVPQPQDYPMGCRFVTRCDQVQAPCEHTNPSWSAHNQRQKVKCFLYSQATPTGQLPSPAIQSDQTNTTFIVDHKSSPPEKLLEVSQLKIYFPVRHGLFNRVHHAIKAVDGVDLTLYSGQTLALVGESGCGKTTVGKGIVQLEPPTGGSIRYAGQELVGLRNAQLQPLRKNLQMIFQDPFAAMNPRMRIVDIVGEGLQALNLEPKRSARRQRVIALLEQVGLDEQACDRYPHEFSGGQRQRICIARALAVEPKVLICDEPTSALDVSVQARILNLLHDLQQTLGLAYLFISHDLAVVSYIAQSVAVMYLGRLVEQGSVEQILNHPAHPYTQALLSAIPVIDADQRRQRLQLEGDPPSPVTPPSGCHFHPRCPRAQADCQQHYPPLQILAPGHVARCHHVCD
jgi:peptide/nickel transport system ATP-binding protein